MAEGDPGQEEPGQEEPGQEEPGQDGSGADGRKGGDPATSGAREDDAGRPDAFPFRPSDHAPTIEKLEFVFKSGEHVVDGEALRPGFDVHYAQYHFYDHAGERHGPKRHVLFERGDSVAVLPVIEATREVVLVDQFRIATYLRSPPDNSRRGWILETVAGMPKRIDANGGMEGLEDTAIRETGEETGLLLQRDELKSMGWYWSSPGGTSERVVVYLALTTGRPHPEYRGAPRYADRAIKVRRMPISEFLELAEEGKFVDPKLAFAALGLNRLEKERRQIVKKPGRRLFAVRSDDKPSAAGPDGGDDG